MKAEIIKKVTDAENGIESRLVKTVRGLVVGIWDIDCNEPLSDLIIFAPDIENQEQVANNYFNKINKNDGTFSVRIL